MTKCFSLVAFLCLLTQGSLYQLIQVCRWSQTSALAHTVCRESVQFPERLLKPPTWIVFLSSSHSIFSSLCSMYLSAVSIHRYGFMNGLSLYIVSFIMTTLSLNPNRVGINNVSPCSFLFALAWYLLACSFVLNIFFSYFVLSIFLPCNIPWFSAVLPPPRPCPQPVSSFKEKICFFSHLDWWLILLNFSVSFPLFLLVWSSCCSIFFS